MSVHQRAHHDEQGARERPGGGDQAGALAASKWLGFSMLRESTEPRFIVGRAGGPTARKPGPSSLKTGRI